LHQTSEPFRGALVRPSHRPVGAPARVARAIALLAVAAALTLASGCGVIATIGLGIAALTDSGGSTTTVETPITVEAPTLARASATTATLTFTIRGPSGATALVRCDHAAAFYPGTPGSLPSPETFTAIRLSAAQGAATIETVAGTTLARVVTEPNGATASLEWDLAADGLPGGRRVFLRAVPVLEDGSEAGDAVDRGGATPAPVFVGNDPPIARLGVAPTAEQAGTIGLPYTLFDTAGDPVSITAEFSTNGGATFAPASSSVSQRESLLSSNPTAPPSADPSSPALAFAHTYVWEALSDPGARAFQGSILLRITASDRFGPGPATTTSLLVDNNAPPQVAIATPPRSVTGEVDVDLSLSDLEADPASLEVLFEETSGALRTGTATITAGSLAALTATAQGEQHRITWAYASPLDLGSNRAARARLRIRALDATGDAGVFGVSAPFDLGNDPPTATAGAPTDLVSRFAATVPFTLFDPAGDIASISVRFSIDGGLSFATATAGSAAFATNLPTQAPNDPNAPASLNYGWDAVTDAPGFTGSAILEITPRDGLQGGVGLPVLTPAFNVNNSLSANTPPFVVIGAVNRSVGGVVEVPFTVVDLESDTVTATIVVEDVDAVSVTGFQPMTLGAGGDDLGQLTSATSTGAPHRVFWSYGTQPGFGLGARRARIRIQPQDDFASGIPATTPLLIVGNDAPVIVVAPLAPTERSGTVAVSYTLFDTTADPVSLTAEFSAGGAAFAPATTVVSQRTNLLSADPASRTAAFAHTFVWESPSDPASATFQGPVTLRFTPLDAFAAGSAVTIAALLDNNAPPIATVDTPARTDAGTVTMTVLLRDAEGDLAGIDARWETVGEPSPRSGTATFDGGAPGLLATSSAGIAHALRWSYQADLGSNAATRVRFRVRAVDAVGDADLEGISGTFVVGNTAPLATVRPPASLPAKADIPIPYSIFDPTGDVAAIDVFYSTTGGAPFTTARAAIAGSDTNIASQDPSDPTQPFNGSFLWASGLDLVDFDGDVVFRIVPRDGRANGVGDATVTAAFRVDNLGNRAPTVDVTSAPRTVTGTVAVQFRIFDFEGATCSARVEVSKDDVTYVTATADVSSGPLTGLASATSTAAPGGAHAFVWDYGTHPGFGLAARSVFVRIAARDETEEGALDKFGPFVIGNDAPVLAITPTTTADLAAGEKVGAVAVGFTLLDSSADPVSLAAEFSKTGPSGPFFPARTLVSQVVNLLSTDPATPGEAFRHVFVWDSAATVGSETFQGPVVIRLTPHDGFTAGVAATVAATIDNNQPPALLVETPARSDAGEIGTSFTLFDPEGDAAAVVIRWETTEGATRSGTATITGGVPAALTATAGGRRHDFTWPYAAATDLGSNATAHVRLRVQAIDATGDRSLETLSGAFVVGNNAPAATVTTPGGTRTGEFSVPFTLLDDTGDTAAIEVAYSVDGGPFLIATTTTAVEGLPTAIPGQPGVPTNLTVSWKSDADLKDFDGPVRLRITPTDRRPGSPGAATTTASFRVDNFGNRPPSALPGVVARTVSGTARIPFRLVDPDGETLTASVEVSLDGQAFVQARAHATSPTLTGLASVTSTPGALHELVWDYENQPGVGFGGLTAKKVTARVTPSDPSGVGGAGVTSQFVVGNDAPAATILASTVADLAPSLANEKAGAVAIGYSLFDTTADPVSITAEFSRTGPGGPFFDARTRVSQTTNLLSADPTTPTAAFTQIFVWGTRDTPEAATLEADVVFRLTPSDGFTAGQPVTVAARIDNNAPPLAIVGTPPEPRSVSGTVEVAFELRDAEGDPASVELGWRTTTAPVRTGTATLAAGAVGGLATSPGGTSHAVVWDYGTDLGSTATARVQFFARAVDDAGDFDQRGASGIFAVGNNPPVAAIATPPGGSGGTITISYALFDDTADVASIEARYSTNGGVTFTAATLDTQASGLATRAADGSGGPALLQLAWRSGADLAGQTPTVIFEVRPRDAFPNGIGAPTRTAAFLVNNASGNTPPSATIDPVLRTVSGTAEVFFTLRDAQGDTATAQVLYATIDAQGGQSAFATAALLSGAQPVTDLATSPSGVRHRVVWDYAPQITTATSRVRVRVVPKDALTGLESDTQPFILGNAMPVLALASATIGSPPADERAGTIAVAYSLQDDTADPVSVAAEISTDGGATFRPAKTLVSQTQNLLSADPVSPTAAFGHVFVWESTSPENPTTVTFQGQVLFRLTPADGFVAGEARTAAIQLDNNAPPLATVARPARAVSQPVSIAVRVSDRETDPANLSVRWATEAGVTGTATVELVAATHTALVPGVAASAAGTEHTLRWRFQDDLANANTATSVRFFVRASDATGDSDLEGDSGAFIVGNDPPRALLATPAVTVTAGFPFQLSLFDSTADAASIRVEFEEQGVGFVTATSVIATAGLATRSPIDPAQPNPIDYIWDMARDLPGFQGKTRLRITPDDGLAGGLGPATTTALFDVDTLGNQRPSVEIVETPRTVTGTTAIRLRLRDRDGDAVAASVSVSADDGGTYHEAVAAAGTPALTGLDLDPGVALETVFLWRYEQQTGAGFGSPAGTSARRVRVRVTARDAAPGDPATSAEFVVGNSAPAAIVTPETLTDLSPALSNRKTGALSVGFTLFDDTADPVAIEVSFVTGTAAPDGPGFATITATTSRRVNLASADPANPLLSFPHQVVWNPAAETLTATYQGPVTIRLRPSDPFTSGSAVTVGAFLDNNQPPFASIQAPDRSDAGSIAFTFTLFDQESDPSRVLVAWEAASGAPASGTATIADAPGSLQGLTTTAAGVAYQRTWSYQADLQGSNAARRVRLKLLPIDATGDAALVTATSAVFEVGNDAPVATIATPGGAVTAGSSYTITLFDTSKDLASIDVRFSSDAGATFATATALVATSGLATRLSTDAGAPNVLQYVWDVQRDLPDFDGLVRLRVTPRDSFANGLGAATETASFRLDNLGNRPPVLGFEGAIARTVSGTSRIAYSLIDADGDPVSVTALVSIDGGAAVLAERLAGSEGVVGLSAATITPGVLHEFIWDYGAQLGGATPSRRVRALFQPNDGLATGLGAQVASVEFIVGNEPPVVTVTAQTRDQLEGPAASEKSGALAIGFTLFDRTADLADLDISFVTGTAGPGAPGFTPATSLVSRRTNLLSADPAAPTIAFTHTFVWETTSDTLTARYEGPVTIRIAPRDAFAEGLAVTVGARIDNNQPPFASIQAPARTDTGAVEFTFTLFDREADVSRVEVAWEDESGASSGPATIVGAPGVLEGLATAEAGVPRSLTWSYAADGGANPARRVRLKLRPIDATGDPAQVTATSAVFVVGNTPPTMTATTPASPAGGVIPVAFTLFDDTGDQVDLDVAYVLTATSDPDHPGFLTATANPVGSNVNLSTTSGGVPTPVVSSFNWASGVDLPAQDVPAVTLRLRPRDRLLGGLGAPTLTAAFRVDNLSNRPSRATIDGLVLRTVSGTARVAYRLSDADGEPVTVTAEVSVDGAEFIAATRLETSEGLTNLATAANETGAPHEFIWSYQAQFGDYATRSHRAIVRLTPFDGPASTTGVAGSTPEFVFGNEPPVVTVTSDTRDQLEGPSAGEKTGAVAIGFTLFDPRSDLTDLEVSFVTGTAGSGASGFVTATSLVSNRTNLLSAEPASPSTAFGHTFVWETTSDTLTATYEGPVTIRIRPRDAFDAGSAVTLGARIDNNQPPFASIQAPARSDTGSVAFTFTLFDREADISRVQVAWEVEGGSPSGVATINGMAGTLEGLATSQAGVAYSPTWSYQSDIGTNLARRVRLRLLAIDATGDAAAVTATSAVFVVGNSPPTVTATTPASPAGGVVPVSFTLFDDMGDQVDLDVAYAMTATSNPDHAGFLTATANPVGSNLNLPTTSGGVPAVVAGAFNWASGTDLKDLDIPFVTLRLRPRDGGVGGVGTTVLTGAFRVDNLGNRPSAVSIDGPILRTVSGTARIPYRLVDADLEPVTVTAEVSVDGGAFVTATRFDPSEGLLGLAATATPPGAPHEFVWSYQAQAADFATRSHRAVVRLTPFDGPSATTGAAASTAEFIFGNEPPALTVTASTRLQLEGPVPPAVEQGASVAIGFTLFDPRGDLTDLDVSFVTGTAGPGASGYVTATSLVSNRLNLLSAEPLSPTTAFGHTFVWATSSDALTSTYEGPVTVRLRPRDAFDVGVAVTVGARVDNNLPPSLRIDTPARSTSGMTQVSIRVLDADGGGALITPRFFTSGASVSSPATVIGLPSPAAGSAGGIVYPIQWNYQADFGGSNAARVVTFAATAVDVFGDAIATESTGAFVVGNTAPVATISAPPTTVSADVTVPLTLFDDTADLVSIRVEFRAVSPTSTTYAIASSSTAVLNLASTTPGVPTRPADVTFVWRSRDNLDAFDGTVQLRLTPTDQFGLTGTPVETTAFRLDNIPNRVPAVAFVQPFVRSTNGTVGITFTANDPDGEPIRVRFQYLDGNAFEDIAGLPNHVTVTSGTHTFSWNYAAPSDLGDTSGVFTRLQAIASDAVGPTPPVTSDEFIVGNDAPVVSGVTLLPATGNVSGTIVVRFNVSDSTRDSVTVNAEYSLSGPSGTFRPITAVVGGALSLPGVDTAPAQRDFSWNTLGEAGVGTQNVPALVVRLTPRDPYSTGVASTSSARPLRNDTPPSAQILSIGTETGAKPVDGRVPVRFALFDAEADLDPQGSSGRPDVKVEVSIDSGRTYSEAAVVALGVREDGREKGVASLKGLRARPFGTPASDPDSNIHSIILDARSAEIRTAASMVVFVRITPSAGIADTLGFSLSPTEGIFEQLVSNPSNLGAFLTSTPGEVFDLAPCDLNGDQHPDLIFRVVQTTPPTAQVVRTLLGIGSRQFNLGASLSLGTVAGATISSSQLRLGDFDGDGLSDLTYTFFTTSSGLAHHVLIRKGLGNGTFAASVLTDATVPNMISGGFEVADVDRDGNQDVILNGLNLVNTSRDLVLFYGVGDGTLQAPVTLPLGTQSTSSAVLPKVADMNGDGLLDIVLVVQDEITVARATGARTYAIDSVPMSAQTSSVQEIEVADLNDDGRLDLLVVLSGLVTSYIQSANLPFPAFSEVSSSSIDLTNGGSVGDVDGDGILDVVLCTANFGNIFSPAANYHLVMLGTGDGRFRLESRLLVPTEADELALLDTDFDGRLEIHDIRATGSPTLSTRLPTDDLRTTLESIGPDRQLERLALGDVDGDGVLDVVASTATPAAEILRGTGAGDVELLSDFVFSSGPPREWPTELLLRDVSGDGRLDIVATSTDDGLVGIAQGDGTGGFGSLQTSAIGGATLRLLTGDLGGSSAPDVVVASRQLDSVRLLLGAGGGALDPFTGLSGVDFTIRPDIAVADLDLDGRTDIVYTSAIPNDLNLRFFQRQPSGAFTIADRDLGTETQRIELSDFDGDGHADLAHCSGWTFSSGSLGIGRGLGDGRFAPALYFASASDPVGLRSADFDGDGVLDIVTFQGGGIQPSVRFGRTTFPRAQRAGALLTPGRGDPRGFNAHSKVTLVSTPVGYDTGAGVQGGFDVGDMNGDGLPEVVVSGIGGIRTVIPHARVSARPVAGLAAALSTPAPGNGAVRRIPVAPLDPSGMIRAGQSDRRFVQASRAHSYLPESATLSSAQTISLPLFSTLSQEELDGAVVRVFREEQDLVDPSQPPSQVDPRTGALRRSRLVEVARRNPQGGSFPAGLTLDTTAGTISFPVTRLGRYQAFLEAPQGAVVLYRETFDAHGADASGRDGLPLGWWGNRNWRVGAPRPSDISGSVRPAPASAPNLLANGLLGTYRRGGFNDGFFGGFFDTEELRSAEITIPPLGGDTRRVILRLRHWFDLALDDFAQGWDDVIEINILSQNGTQLLSPGPFFTGRASATPALGAALESDITSVVSAGGKFRVAFRLYSGGNVGPASGWFIDDVEIVLRP